MADLASIGKALGHPVRSAIVSELMDGRLLPAGVLARIARVSRSSASEHLALLLEVDIVRVVSTGRHRFYGLASGEIARALEVLGTLAAPAPVRSLAESDGRAAEAFARMCWDHLAGRLGVAMRVAIIERGWAEARGDGMVLTDRGTHALRSLGAQGLADGDASGPCVDVTERRLHTAGQVGRSIATLALEERWLVRRPGGRALTVTPEGVDAFDTAFGLRIEPRARVVRPSSPG